MLPDKLVYGSLIDYSPRDQTEDAHKSRAAKGLVKNGNEKFINVALDLLLKRDSNFFNEILNSETTLVPVPRSTPLFDKDTVWPSLVIAKVLVAKRLGKKVLPCLIRSKPVPKSSSRYTSDTRTSVEEHYNSFQVNKELFSPKNITLVDDIITQGRTMYASAQAIHDAFPDSKILAFSLIRTKSRDFEKDFNPSIRYIQYYSSGKTYTKH